MSVTITHVEVIESTYQGKTKKSYKFTLSDGKIGYSANKSPWEFKEGEAVDYTSETKKSAKGEYNLFTFARVAGSAAPQGTPPPTPPKANLPHAAVDIARMKFESRMQVCKLTHDLILAGKFSDLEAVEHLKAWTIEMDNLIDGIF